jgi:hypothetical protein
MNSKIDPAKLTAYALGELRGPEAAEIEALLALDPEAMKQVQEIRALGSKLKNELAREPLPDMNKVNRQRTPWRATQYAAAAFVLLLLLYPVGKKLMSRLPHFSEEDSALSESSAPSPMAAADFLESLNARPTTSREVKKCRFELPRLNKEDSGGQIASLLMEGTESLQLKNLYQADSLSLSVVVGWMAKGIFSSQPGDEVKNTDAFRSVTRRLDPATVSIYKMSKAALSYYCWVSVKLESMPETGSETLQSPLESLAKKIAGND